MTKEDVIFKDSLEEFKKAAKITSYPSSPDETYKQAVEHAYKDLQWRTIKGHNNDNKEKNIAEISNLVKENIESKGKHITLIEEVEEVFKKDFENIPANQCFGKAQKAVNMTIKYLYCFNHPSIKVDYENRDIPLDDRIIAFYDVCNKKKDNVSWSKIEKNKYDEIQKKLKKCCIDIGLDMFPIEAEFIIWNYSSAKQTIEDYEKIKNHQKATYNSYEFVKESLKNL